MLSIINFLTAIAMMGAAVVFLWAALTKRTTLAFKASWVALAAATLNLAGGLLRPEIDWVNTGFDIFNMLLWVTNTLLFASWAARTASR